MRRTALSDVGKGPLRSHAWPSSLRAVASAEGGMTEKAPVRVGGAVRA